MTREEAIEVLKDIISKPMLHSNHIIDACRVALASLEAENDLGVDCVSRQAVDSLVWEYLRHETKETIAFYEHFLDLPSITPQEPQSFKWCRDCKEYDQDKHCCHRWSKVIRDTVEEMKQEQESVIDKIRAEIEQEPYISKMEVLDILDKYKAESENP